MKNPIMNFTLLNTRTTRASALPPRAIALSSLVATLLALLSLPAMAQAVVSVFSQPSALNAATPNTWSNANGNVALLVSGGGTFTIPSDSASGRMLVVTISGEVGTEPTSVTWGLQTMTKVTSRQTGSGNTAAYSGIWYLVDPTAGTGSLAVAGYVGTRFCAYAVYATGISQGLPEGSAAGGNNSNTSTIDTDTPASITPSAGALLVTAYGGSPTGSGTDIVSAKIVRSGDNTEPTQTTPPRAANANSVAASGHMIAGGASPLKGRTTVTNTGGTRSITLASFAPLVAPTQVFNNLLVEAPVSSVTAGTAFNVTITGRDSNNVTVNNSIATVTMSSPSSLMEFDWDGNGTYGDNSGTLASGVRTIKARNRKAETTTIAASGGGGSTTAPPSVTTIADAFTKLQILVPGESSAAGTTSGKTGTASTRTFATSFNVTVNAVDQFWNPINTVIDDVGITSSDAAATLSNGPLIAGIGTFAMTLNTAVGSFTATATNISDNSKTADTSSAMPVSATFTWQGDGSANLWNTTTTTNWLTNGSPIAYTNGVSTIFPEIATNRTVNLVGNLTTAGITVSNSTGSYSFGGSGSIGGAGGLTKSSAGTLTISTANTYLGATIISGGTLSTNTIADSVGSGIGFGPMTLSGGSLSYTGSGAATTGRVVTHSASSTISVTEATASLTLSGSVNGGAANFLTKTGPGTLVLSGTTDNGFLVLNAQAGEVQLGKTVNNFRALAGISGIASGATVKLIGTGIDQIFNGNGTNQGVNGIVTGGTLNLNGFSEAVSFLNGTGGVVDGGSGTPTLTVGDADTTSVFGGIIQNTTGTLNLTKNGTGSLTLSAANTYSGTTTVSGGTIVVNNNSAIQNSALATVGGAATKLVLGVGITTPTFGGLSGASVSLNSTLVTNYGSVTSLTLNPIAGTVTYGGAITNGANGMTLTKTGAGTQVLSGINTYTGLTSINAGRLSVTGSLASGVTVNGGTLAGNGNLGGDVTIASGATHELAVAATAGAQVARAITGTLALNSGNILNLTAASAPALGEYVLATATVGITGTPSIVNFNGLNGIVTVDTVSNPKRLLLNVGVASITLNGASITAVDTTYGAASPTPTQFTVDGAFLNPSSGNLTVTPPTGYQVSLSSGSGYSTSLAVPYSSSTLSSTTVFLRLAANAGVAGSPYSGNISVSGGGVSSQTIATVSSAVSMAPLTITANSRSKGFGQTVSFGTGSSLFTTSGLVNGETIGSVTLASTGGASVATAGTYPITPSDATGGTFSVSNYTTTYSNGTLTVLGLNEYVFGTTNTGVLVLNPNGTIASRGQAPIIQTTLGSSVVTLTYARLKNSGSSFGAEFSSNLSTWLPANHASLIYAPGSPSGESVFDNGDEMEVVSIKFPIFINTGAGFTKMQENFCRIAVTP